MPRRRTRRFSAGDAKPPAQRPAFPSVPQCNRSLLYKSGLPFVKWGQKGGSAVQDISKRIKQLRQKSGMTQEALANRLHVTRQAVSNWETRKTRPDVDTLEALAQAFDVDVTRLLYGEAPAVPRTRRWLPTAVFGGMTAVWLLLTGLAVPAANESMKRTFDAVPVLTLQFVCTILSAALFPFLFSALPFDPPRRRGRGNRTLSPLRLQREDEGTDGHFDLLRHHRSRDVAS